MRGSDDLWYGTLPEAKIGTDCIARQERSQTDSQMFIVVKWNGHILVDVSIQ